MKILLFGKNGQLGWELNRSLLALGTVEALSREQADFSSPDSLREIVRKVKPDVIVNAAAYTAVDKAEQEEELALLVNGVAPGVLAEEAGMLDALLLHYSTDYVFDGSKHGAYVETDTINPVNAYGRSKFAGEKAIRAVGCDHLILRTSWVYGARCHNFFLSILNHAKEKNELSVVCDQYGVPNWTRMIADVSGHVIKQASKEQVDDTFISDVYHLSCRGRTTWFDFAESIIAEFRNQGDAKALVVDELIAIPSSDYSSAARRPVNSVLDQSRLEKKFMLEMPVWNEAFKLCMQEYVSR